LDRPGVRELDRGDHQVRGRLIPAFRDIVEGPPEGLGLARCFAPVLAAEDRNPRALDDLAE
jgi:hypothetical protein